MHITYPCPQKPIDHGCSWPAQASLHPALSLRRDLRRRQRSHLRCGKCPSGVGQALCQHPFSASAFLQSPVCGARPCCCWGCSKGEVPGGSKVQKCHFDPREGRRSKMGTGPPVSRLE